MFKMYTYTYAANLWRRQGVSIYLSIYLFIYLSIYLFIYLSKDR